MSEREALEPPAQRSAFWYQQDPHIKERGLFLLETWLSMDIQRLSSGAAGQQLKALQEYSSTDSTAWLICNRARQERIKWEAEERFAHLLEPPSCAKRITDQWTQVVLLEKVSEAELAFVLTWAEWLLFANIPLREFLLKRQTKVEESPKYHALIRFYNTICLWIQTCLVTEPDIARRVQLLRRLIKVADQLHKLRNYSGLSQIVFSLTGYPISRLTETWQLVPAAEQQHLRYLNGLVSPLKNFAVLREQIAQAAPPFLPPMFLAAKDIFSLEEASETWCQSGFINWNKLRTIGELIVQTLMAKKNPYFPPPDLGFEPETLSAFSRFLYHPSPLEQPERINQLSILCQPIVHS